MAQFRGTIQGQLGEVSRLGGKSTGLTANANGWRLGVKVEAHYDAETGEDCFKVYVTGGSNGNGSGDLIAVIRPTNIKLYNASELVQFIEK